MRKLIACLIMLFTSKVAIANNQFICEIEDSGEVNLTYVYSKAINQKLKAFIGVEKWSDPFAIKAKCEMLKYELVNAPEEQWGNYECENYGIATAIKYITIKLTDKGKIILNKPEWEKLLFVPTRPVEPYFVNSIEDTRCDPY